MTAAPRITVIGPAAWNHLIVVDELPQPRSQMVAALDSWWTVGGTSAGKALHLLDLGADVTLVTPVGDDDDGTRLRRALEAAGLTAVTVAADATESHTNLMSTSGERLSLYTSAPREATTDAVTAAIEASIAADVVVVDMSPLGRAALPAIAGLGVPVWTDLHDWNGADGYHRPFADAATVVTLNDDGGGDRDAIMEGLRARGAHLVIRTLGAEGATALTAEGTRHQVPADPVDAIVDTNGAGDAFTAGALIASVRGAGPEALLRSGATQASRALGTRHLSPLLD
ncbi:carbohydrate kinase family protein [uncultured Demequina sp.]|uniref:carbohydrate kinase family protein n=1 Tax=uncultured Demequina sp. TaxID=693499 RepID=UPI0025CD1302|nr:carbohydrate kinase family protein [uncultured Demequina sp.]